MELFKITCVTCQAKLSVRNESLIGQIVACPRCDSMVQIERPAGAVAMLAEPVESAPVQPPSQPAPIPQPVADLSEPVAAPVVEPPVASVEDSLEGAEVSSNASQINAAIVKYKLLSWTLGAFIAGAAVVGTFVLIRGSSSTEAVPASPVVQKSPEKKSSVPTTTPVADTASGSSEAEVEVPKEIETATAEPVAERKATEKVAAVVKEAPVIAEPSAAVEPEPVAEVPQLARRFDPLDFDPESLDLAAISRTGTESAPESNTEESATKEPSQDSEIVPDVLPSTLPSVRRDPEQTITPAVAEEKLKQKFPALQVKKIPLGDFLALVSRLADIPVSIGPAELQMAGITARKEVSLDTKDLDLNEALRSVLEPLHLEAKVEGPLVRIVRKGGSKQREVNYPLDDLSSSASVDEIAAWVEQLVSPAEWKVVGGDGTIQPGVSSLKVMQIQRVQYQVLIFLERLRLAYKLPPRSRFPIKRFASKPAYAALASRLEAPTVFTFSRFTALQEIIRHWEVELGVPVLVDWPALAEVDLWPQTRIACSVDGKSWRTALSEVLEPIGLGWRSVAGEMLEITTSQKMQIQPQLELYSLSQSPTAGADRMLAELELLSQETGANEPTAVEYDSGAKVVFVLQPATVQRKVYSWLVKNRLIVTD